LDNSNRNLQENLMAEKERRSAAQEKNARIPELDEVISRQTGSINKLQEEAVRSKGEEARLKAELENVTRNAEERLEIENKHFREKLSFVVDAREELTAQFKNLANGILEINTKTFTEQNKTNLDALLKPLGDKIRDFEKRVVETYDKESKERFSLESEIKNLRQLNTQISQDALNLTNALRGQTKTQGTWGEVILERVLESSGLGKGREYEVQVCETDEDGRRMQPDVIVHLPENRHLIVDSKVNLRAYEQYCTMESGADRDEVGRKHVQAVKRHISQLCTKEYQDRFRLNSVDFVLMFIPIEPAYTLAVGLESTIFDEALRKKIVIVTPSTLHAMLRTIALVWRQEYQSRNAIEIAQRSGALFDKFVAFVGDLEEIGDRLQATQRSYDDAHKKLCSGQGNLISRAEKIRELGAKARKKLPQHLLIGDAAEDASDELSLNNRTALSNLNTELAASVG
jgi:DNA recombination protein RmuC